MSYSYNSIQFELTFPVPIICTYIFVFYLLYNRNDRFRNNRIKNVIHDPEKDFKISIFLYNYTVNNFPLFDVSKFTITGITEM